MVLGLRPRVRAGRERGLRPGRGALEVVGAGSVRNSVFGPWWPDPVGPTVLGHCSSSVGTGRPSFLAPAENRRRARARSDFHGLSTGAGPCVAQAPVGRRWKSRRPVTMARPGPAPHAGPAVDVSYASHGAGLPPPALVHASAVPRAYDSPRAPEPPTRHEPEALHRSRANARGSPGPRHAAPHHGAHGANARDAPTHGTRWGRHPALGTSWPCCARLGSLSRARRPPGHRAGLPSEPSRGFF